MQCSMIGGRIEAVRLRIAAACARSGRDSSDVTLVAVTKGLGLVAVREAAAAGVRDLGENRVQEAQQKISELGHLRGELTWHMIGHLQTNKVKAALSLFDIIHAVDSLHLAEEISRRALRPVPAFLEVNVAREPSKSGFALEALSTAIESISRFPNLDVRGLMTLAPLAGRAENARPVFRQLREAAARLGLTQLSMGMTNDFEVAVEEGATHVRVGRAIFGETPE